jgi:spore germination protein YaaH
LLLLVIAATTMQPPATIANDPAESAVPTPAAEVMPPPSVGPTPAPTASPTSAPVAPDAGSVVLDDGTVLPPMPQDAATSVHGEMLAAHEDDAIDFGLGGDPTIVRDADGRLDSEADAIGPSIVSTEGGVGSITGLPNGMRREVLGFLPYWMLTDSALANMNYQLVSTIAYFSVGALPDGNLDKGTTSTPSTGWAGWRSPQMTTVIDRAHAAGGKVVLTVTMMAWSTASYDRMRTLLNSSANRSRLVGQIVDAVRQRGADGVNLDFEMVPTDLRAQYTSFVRQVKAALVKAGVGSYLTVCTTGGAASWATGYDVPALTASGAADAIFVMGYDFHWSGSARAGGVAPIDSPYVLDVSDAMADFLEQAPASKLIWGVPYYGRGWSTTSSQLNGQTTGGSFSHYYTGHLRDAGTHGRLWDAVGKVPWYRFWDAAKGSWVQVYYDDTASLGVKYDLVNRYNLAGTGMWTLLMDGERSELWRLLASKFVDDTSPPVGGVTVLPRRTTSMAFEVRWNAIDYQSGLDYYNVQVRDRASTTWTTWLSRTRATGGTYIGTPGRAYEFRIQAVDWRGNAQTWRTSPGMPSEVRPGTFAEVSTSILNARSGAGTAYASVDSLAAGERVYVMSGPVSADGMSWFQVQHSFAEWPSAEYPHIGWVALGSGSSAYIVPSYAPNVSRLQPFLSDYALTLGAFSPNGDGVRDTISVRYTLPTPVSSMQVDIVDASDRLVRRLTLGAQPAGSNVVSWNGRTSAGAYAADGRYLIKILVTDGSGAVHAAPAFAAAANVVARWGFTLDRTAPSVAAGHPSDGAELLPASTRPTVTFDESMTNLSGSTVLLERVGGDPVAVGLGWNASTRRLTVTPVTPLGVSAVYRLSLTGVTDVAGNPLGAWSAEFSTAPGQVIAPARRFTVLAGTHTAYAIGAGGDVTAARTVTFTRASGALTSQRATLPNLPGRWMYVENGTWAGMWLPESSRSYVAGEFERTSFPTSTRLAFAAGTHTGYRFDASGAMTGTRTATLSAASGANVSLRAIINGHPHWWVNNGIWAGWWMPESARAHRAGFIDQMSLPTSPRISLRAGTYTAYGYDVAGARLSAKTATLTRASGAPTSAWAIVNGRPHYLVAAGIWAGLWLPVDDRVTLAP